MKARSESGFAAVIFLRRRLLAGDGLTVMGKSVKSALLEFGVVSSAGRASALQAEGRRFDPVTTHHFPYDFRVLPLDR